eukprot:jgi/Hompol1/1728/HPOL_004949-RA
MPLIYALVSRGTTILAEHATETGNFKAISEQLLAKLPTTGAATAASSSNTAFNNSELGAGAAGAAGAGGATGIRMTYSFDSFLFHTLQRNGISFLCMAEEEFGRRVPFAFLDECAKRFESAYAHRAQTAIAYGLNDFAPQLQQLMFDFSHGPHNKVAALQGELDSVRGIMASNIERVLERGAAIENLVDKTESLNQASFAFKKRSTALRRAMWWKNTRLLVVMGS